MRDSSKQTRRTVLKGLGSLGAVSLTSGMVSASSNEYPEDSDSVKLYRTVTGAGSGLVDGEYHFESLDLPASGDIEFAARVDEVVDASGSSAMTTASTVETASISTASTGDSYSGTSGDGWSATVTQTGTDQWEWSFEPNNDAGWALVHFADPGSSGWVGYTMDDSDGDGTYTYTRDTSNDGDEIDFKFVYDDGAGGQYESARHTHTYDSSDKPPAAPTDLTVTDKTTSTVDISWTASDSEDDQLIEYIVYVDDAEVQRLEAGTTETTVKDLAPDTTYEIGLVAASLDGAKSDQKEVFTTTLDANGPVTYSGSSGQGWTAFVSRTDLDQREFVFKPPEDVAWADVQFTDPGTNGWAGYGMDDADDNNLFVYSRDTSNDGGAIDFRFVYDDGAGGQYISDRFTHTYDTDQWAPKPPTNLQVDDTGGSSIDISWTTSDSERDMYLDYIVYVNGTQDQQLSVGSSEATIAGLDPDSVHHIAVTAVSSGNESDAATAQATTDPVGAVSGILATDDAGSFSLLGVKRDGGVVTVDGTGSEVTVEQTTDVATPCWIAVERTNGQYTATVSSDGSNWQDAGNFALDPAASGSIGLATTSGKSGELLDATYSDVLYDGLQKDGADAWTLTTDTNGDGGTPDYRIVDGQYEVDGIGYGGKYPDGIEATFVDQPIGSDAWVSAKVTDTEASGGVAMRTSDHEKVIQVDASENSISMDFTFGGAPYNIASDLSTSAPVYVALRSDGTTIKGYYSTDGSTWTHFGTETFGEVLDVGGLVANSTNEDESKTTTFEDVIVSDEFDGADVGTVDAAGSLTFE